MSGDRYISQNALITEIAKIHGNLNTKNVGQAIWDTPTADVVEVRHGTWIEQWCEVTGGFITEGYICSKCGCEVGDTEDNNYCSKCGAKMDGERREENEG